MLSIIVLEEGKRANTDVTLQSIRSSATNHQLTIIGTAPESGRANERVIKRGSSLAHDLQSVIAASAAEQILIISGGLALSERAFADLISNGASSTSSIAYPAMQIGEELIEHLDHEVSSIPSQIGASEYLPFGIALVRREFAIKHGNLTGDSLSNIIAQLYVIAVANNENVDRMPVTIEVDSDSASILSLAALDRAATLRIAISNCNIEELFPTHAWSIHHEESAAAAYHSLAAIFIKLGDFESAQSCLNLSDQLEDSPRSLALKAMIALNQGEVLVAVANLVSSLQQYETRKKGSSEHYLTFNPMDLNEINTRLCQGLEALNRRENKDALGHFAEAVFNFDSFYKEFGLDVLKGGSH
jgi:hypothetical protein